MHITVELKYCLEHTLLSKPPPKKNKIKPLPHPP